MTTPPLAPLEVFTFIIQMVHKSQWDLIEGDKTGKSAIIWRRNILPRKSYYKLYCSASGGAGGGNIPPEVCITNLKPDITIWEKTNEKFHIFELTCPLMTNIDKQHEYKTNKYAHFLTDISHLHTSVTAFEITSTGHITQRNHTHLQALHKFCKPGIKLGNFKKNISGLSICSSYHIWPCRSDPLFQEPPFLPPPFPDRLWGIEPFFSFYFVICCFSCCDQTLVKPCPWSECKLGKLVILVVAMHWVYSLSPCSH